MLAQVKEEFDVIKIFSATKARDRELLSDRVNKWIDGLWERERGIVVGATVTQSSDNAFHCLTITVFGKFLDDEEDAE